MMNETRRETINTAASKVAAEAGEVREALFNSYNDDDYTLEYRFNKLTGQASTLTSVVERLSVLVRTMTEEQAENAQQEQEIEWHGEFVYIDEDVDLDLGKPEEVEPLPVEICSFLAEMNAIKAFARQKLTQYTADFPDHTRFWAGYSSQICLHFKKKFPDGNVFECEAMEVAGGECIGDFIFCFYL